MPVTGERSQLVVGKGILQVAVVGVVEHGLDTLPGAGCEKSGRGKDKRGDQRGEWEPCPDCCGEPGVGVRAGPAGLLWDEGKLRGWAGSPIPNSARAGRPAPSPVVGRVGRGAIRARRTLVQGQQRAQKAERDEQPERHRARVLSPPPPQQQPPPPAHPGRFCRFFRESAPLRLRTEPGASHFRTTRPRMQCVPEPRQRARRHRVSAAEINVSHSQWLSLPLINECFSESIYEHLLRNEL